jgi:hypothetical protein
MREHETRTEDEIDRDLIAASWRLLTQPANRRALRYDTLANATYGWLFIDMFDEWSRHRNKPIV